MVIVNCPKTRGGGYTVDELSPLSVSARALQQCVVRVGFANMYRAQPLLRETRAKLKGKNRKPVSP